LKKQFVTETSKNPTGTIARAAIGTISAMNSATLKTSICGRSGSLFNKLPASDPNRSGRPEGIHQTQLNAALDLDKNERQIAPSLEDDIEPEGDVIQGPSIPARVQRNCALGVSA
jgi:hypothetical protein